MKIGKIKIKLRSKEITTLKALIIAEIFGTLLLAFVGYQVSSKSQENAFIVTTIATLSLVAAIALVFSNKRLYATMLYTVNLGFYIGLSIANFAEKMNFILDLLCAALAAFCIWFNYKIMFISTYKKALENAEKYYKQQGLDLNSEMKSFFESKSSKEENKEDKEKSENDNGGGNNAS